MLGRREFLATAAATFGATLATTYAGAQEKGPTITNTLENIASILKERKLVASAVLHPVENPSMGFVQWSWRHFRFDMKEPDVEHVERVNSELFTAMEVVHAEPNTGLDVLLHEGFIKGIEHHQIAYNKNIHRELIRQQFTRVIPFEVVSDIPPSELVVDRELLNRKNLEKKTNQIVYVHGKPQNMHLSPLARLGAGYMMHAVHGVIIEPAEDPIIDAKAEAAETSHDPEEFKRWVFIEREKYLLSVAERMKTQIVHLIMGHDHVLTDDIAAANENGARISHLVIEVPGVVAARKADRRRLEITPPPPDQIFSGNHPKIR